MKQHIILNNPKSDTLLPIVPRGICQARLQEGFVIIAVSSSDFSTVLGI